MLTRSLSQVVFRVLIALGGACLQFSAQALDPAKPPGGNFNLTNFYLGLPVDSSGGTSGDSASITAAQLTGGYSNALYFYTGPVDGAMVFWAPVTGATTPNSSYPRSELREQLIPPSNSTNWLPYGNHLLSAQCRVTQVPSTGKVIIGQIHCYTGNARPLLKLQYNNGVIEALVKTNSNYDPDFKFYFQNVGLSNLISYQIHQENGWLTTTVNGSNQAINVFVTDPDWATNGLYFKAGSYCQDNVGDTNEGARLAFYALTRSHSPSITNQPTSRSVVAGSNTTFSVSAAGNGSLRYQWRFNDTNTLAGATHASLALTNVQTTNAGSYSVAVTDSLGSITSAVATLAVNVNVGPSITITPTNQTVVAGQNATFTVVASGTAPLSYQWCFNATNNPAWATNASLTITNAQSTNAGSYSVVVTNAYGPAVTSAVAVLTVNAASSNLLARARYQGVISSQFPMYYNPLDDSLAPAVGTGTFTASATGTGFGNDYFGNANGAASFSDTSAQLSYADGGSIVNGVGAANSIGSLSLLFYTPNTALSGTQYIFSNGDVQTSGTGYQFALSLSGGVLQLKAGNKTIVLPTLAGGTWYYFATTWDFSGANSSAYGINYYLGVAGQPAGSLSSGFVQRGGTGNISSTAILGTNGAFVLSGRQPPANSGSGFQISGAPGLVDELATWNSQLSASQIADHFSALIVNNGPSITTPPTNQTVVAGQNATFTVVADGAAPLSYQWRFNATTNLAWASNASLTITNAQSLNAGSYAVVVTNPYGSATSAVATLTVAAPPTLGIQASGTNAIISWPSSTDPGFVLESTPDLVSPTWVSAGTPVVIGDRNVVTNAVVGDAQFYRLKK
jgi:Alginate lyase/Immunoglobulin domain